MALLQIDHKPQSVQMNLPLYVILPDSACYGKKGLSSCPVLFLLHGLSEDGSAWQRHSEVETLAEAYGLVVIMPSCGRSFYADLPTGQNWFYYLTEELPDWLQHVLHISLNPHRTFIAGSSMGGYGAIKAALHRPATFSAAASFSGVLSMAIVQQAANDNRQHEFELLFGKLQDLPGGVHDPLTWARLAGQDYTEGRPQPHLMVCCGRQDELLPLSRQFRDTCRQSGLPLTYHEERGGHEWLFWNRQLHRFLAFALPQDRP